MHRRNFIGGVVGAATVVILPLPVVAEPVRALLLNTSLLSRGGRYVGVTLTGLNHLGHSITHIRNVFVPEGEAIPLCVELPPEFEFLRSVQVYELTDGFETRDQGIPGFQIGNASPIISLKS